MSDAKDLSIPTLDEAVAYSDHLHGIADPAKVASLMKAFGEACRGHKTHDVALALAGYVALAGASSPRPYLVVHAMHARAIQVVYTLFGEAPNGRGSA